MEPAIWRLLEVPGSITLGELHDIIQIAMGWEDDHLYMFKTGRGSRSRTYAPGFDDFAGSDIDEDSVTLCDVLSRKGSKLDCIYDFGDNWVHEVRAEKRWSDPSASDDVVCLDGLGGCPPRPDAGEPYFKTYSRVSPAGALELFSLD